MTVPVKRNAAGQLLVRDVATASARTMPGEIDRYNMRREVSMTANIAGADLGSVSRQVSAALQTGRRPAPRRQSRDSRADPARCARCSAAWASAWAWPSW